MIKSRRLIAKFPDTVKSTDCQYVPLSSNGFAGQTRTIQIRNTEIFTVNGRSGQIKRDEHYYCPGRAG